MLKRILRRLIGPSLYSRLGWLKRNGLRHYAICPYLEIDGWLSLDEAITLYDLTRSLPRESPIVVELGVWQGKSTFVISRGLKNKPGARIYCVDPFNADSDPRDAALYQEHRRTFDKPLKERFLEICDAYGMRDQLEVLEGYSYDHSPSWESPIDLLFIDANHTFEAVHRDYAEWAGFVREGGYLLLHDVNFREETGEWSGPGMVVKRHLLSDERFVLHKFVDSLFIAKRIPDRAQGGGGENPKT